MSWQEYVDDHLMCDLPNGGNLKSAAIVGLDGGVWAQSPNFPTLSNDEVDKTVAGFTDAGSATLAQGGLYLGGTKYLVIPGDPGAVIRGKKGQVSSSVSDAFSIVGGLAAATGSAHTGLVIGFHTSSNRADELKVDMEDGVTIKKTNSALVIGIYGEGVQPADGNIVVENLADYLIGQGI